MANVCEIGAFLLILGIGSDIVSMFLIVFSDYEMFNALTIIGTIVFLVVFFSFIMDDNKE